MSGLGDWLFAVYILMGITPLLVLLMIGVDAVLRGLGVADKGLSEAILDRVAKFFRGAITNTEWSRIATHPEMPYRSSLLTDAWQQKRAYMIRKAGFRCQVCNGKQRLEVHHRTYDRLGKEHPDDLTVLCRDCHSHVHGRSVSR